MSNAHMTLKVTWFPAGRSATQAVLFGLKKGFIGSGECGVDIRQIMPRVIAYLRVCIGDFAQYMNNLVILLLQSLYFFQKSIKGDRL
jgi:hypothetical protein